MNAPALFSDGTPVNVLFPFRTVWELTDFSQYRTPGNDFDQRWQVQLAALRAEDAAKREARRQRNLAKYLPSKAA